MEQNKQQFNDACTKKTTMLYLPTARAQVIEHLFRSWLDNRHYFAEGTWQHLTYTAHHDKTMRTFDHISVQYGGGGCFRGGNMKGIKVQSTIDVLGGEGSADLVSLVLTQ